MRLATDDKDCAANITGAEDIGDTRKRKKKAKAELSLGKESQTVLCREKKQ